VVAPCSVSVSVASSTSPLSPTALPLVMLKLWVAPSPFVQMISCCSPSINRSVGFETASTSWGAIPIQPPTIPSN